MRITLLLRTLSLTLTLTLTLTFTFALVGAGCATSTKIVVDTPGAVVIRESDNKELGAAPVEVKTSMWLWESERYVVKKGAQKKTVKLKRSEVDLLPMIGGVCLSVTGCGLIVGVPLILAGGMKLAPETKVSLRGKKDEEDEEKTKTASHRY